MWRKYIIWTTGDDFMLIVAATGSYNSFIAGVQNFSAGLEQFDKETTLYYAGKYVYNMR